MGLSYCTCVFLVTKPSHDTITFDLVIFSLTFDLLFKNFFQTRRDRAFIFHICIPCDKTFHIIFELVTLALRRLNYF